MGMFDFMLGKKDPEVAAAEKKAYEDESKRVKLEKKNAATREAIKRGKEKARGGSGVGAAVKKAGKTGMNVGMKLGEGLISAGKYGASLNWEGATDIPTSRKPTTYKGKGKPKKQRKQKESNEFGFEMPDFDF